MTEQIEDDDEREPLETRVDDQGRTYGVLKPRVKLDKNVAYFKFDQDAQEEAAKIRYLNGLGALGMLEAQAMGSQLKAAVDDARLKYARFISENPWTVPGYGHVQPEPKRWFSGAVLFATCLLAAVVVAAFIRSTTERSTLPASVAAEGAPAASPEAEEAPQPRKGRADRRDSKVIANVY